MKAKKEHGVPLSPRAIVREMCRREHDGVTRWP